MPLPLIPIAIAGAQLGSQVINAMTTSQANKDQLAYNREMYDRQRADALADWTMQNEYNSPQAQMQRFKDAGLNPNLIYGQMTNSPVVRTSSPQSYSPEVAKVDLGSVAQTALSSYFDTQLKEAQINNLKAQNSNILQDTLLKSANVLAVGTNNAIKQTELSNLQAYSADAARESLRSLEIVNRAKLQDIEIKEIMKSPNLQQALQNIKNLQSTNEETKARIQNLLNSGKLQDLDIQLKKNGVQPGDPIYLRMANQLLQNPSATWDSIKGWFKNLTK